MNVLSIEELIQIKEQQHRVIAIINNWVWKSISQEAGMKFAYVTSLQ